MARERMVTRTVNVIDALVMCVSVSTGEVADKTFILTGDIPASDKILDTLKKKYESEDLKLVAIKETSTREELYGMSEIDFLTFAKRLDIETRKPL